MVARSWRARGDITRWISQGAIDAWPPAQTGKRGAQLVCSDLAIEMPAQPDVGTRSASILSGPLRAVGQGIIRELADSRHQSAQG